MYQTSKRVQPTCIIITARTRSTCWSFSNAAAGARSTPVAPTTRLGKVKYFQSIYMHFKWNKSIENKKEKTDLTRIVKRPCPLPEHPNVNVGLVVLGKQNLAFLGSCPVCIALQEAGKKVKDDQRYYTCHLKKLKNKFTFRRHRESNVTSVLQPMTTFNFKAKASSTMSKYSRELRTW